ncbi:hypothetical protein THAOC_27214, partial [Thalassiosira oceanica]
MCVGVQLDNEGVPHVCLLAPAKVVFKGNNCLFSLRDLTDGRFRVSQRKQVGDPVATGFLASAYYNGYYGLLQIDIPRAIELWTEAARLGDLNTHFKLGVIYYKGEGLEQDVVHEYKIGNHELGVQHWMISAKMGYELSLNKIKDMYMEGHATKAQYAESLRGYQTALDETRSPQREEAKTIFNKIESLELVRRREQSPPERRYETLTDPLDRSVVPRDVAPCHSCPARLWASATPAAR